jgi:hypothetical protein
MKLKLMSLAMFAALLGVFVLAPISARAQTPTVYTLSATGANNPGTKTLENGSWQLTQFVEQDGALYAQGQLTGDVLNKNGKVTNSLHETVLLPVSGDSVASLSGARALPSAQATCTILHLVLGPITLKLLGLNIYIGGPGNTPLIVDITGDQSGLLGQLLCGLLGPVTRISQLTDLVNALNTLLGLL